MEKKPTVWIIRSSPRGGVNDCRKRGLGTVQDKYGSSKQYMVKSDSLQRKKNDRRHILPETIYRGMDIHIVKHAYTKSIKTKHTVIYDDMNKLVNKFKKRRKF